MKIAIIGQKGVPNIFGGIETHVTELGTRLVRAGHSVFAYSRSWYTPKGTRMFNGMRVVRLPSIRTKNLDAITHTFISILHAVIFVRPDVYHIHGVGPALLSFIPRILAPTAKTVVTFHCVDSTHGKWGGFAQTMLALGERAAVTFPHETIVVSRVLRGYALETYGATVTYIPNGITPFRGAADPILLAPLKLEPNGYIAMVSRLVKHKGAHTLIEAWKKAKAENAKVFGDLKLAIIGDSAFTDEYVAELKKMAEGDDSIVFTGYQKGETLESLFMGARFIAHPSVSEGLPICILEAMAFGKAVVASDIPEIMEVIEGDHGVPFKAGDASELAARITDLVADPMQAATIGHVAREYVESDYNWNDISKKTMEVYAEKKFAPKAALVPAK
jgi:glycosyltransferase involved in cell wall biosynthesis